MILEKYAVIVAGGKGSRMQTEQPKQFMEIHGRPVIAHTITKFLQSVPDIHVIVVLPEEHLDTWLHIRQAYGFEHVRHTFGGQTRFDSVKNGLKLIPGESGLVAVHDAVRPCVSSATIVRSFEQAKISGSGLAVIQLKDSIRKIENNTSKARSRQDFRLVQTPQTFRVDLLRTAYEHAEGNFFTDDASVFESNGGNVSLIEGNYENIKITTPEDLKVAALFLESEPK